MDKTKEMPQIVDSRAAIKELLEELKSYGIVVRNWNIVSIELTEPLHEKDNEMYRELRILMEKSGIDGIFPIQRLVPENFHIDTLIDELKATRDELSMLYRTIT